MALVLFLVIFCFWFKSERTSNKEQDQDQITLKQIPEQLKKMDIEIKEIKNEIKKETKEIKNEIKKETKEIKNEIKKETKEIKNEIKKETKNEIKEIKNEIIKEIKKEISCLSSQINISVDILSHNYAIEKLEDCSGLIKISPGSNVGNSYACGIFIQIGNKFFFVTCLHVIYDMDTQTVREVERIVLVNNVDLLFKKSVIIFNNINLPDIALIPIKPSENYDSFATKVKKEENYIGQSLFYISRREKNINFGECSVVEVPYNSNTIKTNCGDAHGSSGTGYVNEYGHLVAIHRSQSSFLEFFKNGNNIQFALDSQKEVHNLYLDDEKDLNESSVIKVFFKCFISFFQYFEEIVKYKSKSQRAQAVSSKYIYDLFTNRNQNAIKLKHGEFHELNAETIAHSF